MVDQFSRFKMCEFIKQKSDAKLAIRRMVMKYNERGYKIENLRCDNAGENQTIIRELCENELTGINLEQTAPYTPQQNATVEKAFAYL